MRKTSSILPNSFAATLRLGAISAALLGGAYHVGHAQQVDSTHTQSVSSNPGAANLNQPLPNRGKGSVGFKLAIKLIEKKDYQAAYLAARLLPDPVERRAIQWASIFFGEGAVDHESVRRFEKDAPHFSTRSTYQKRFEQAFLKTDPDDRTIIARLGGALPKTSDGKVALAIAYARTGQKERGLNIVRSMWHNQIIGKKREDRILGVFGNAITRADHWKRAQYLMMDNHDVSLTRLLPRLTKGEASLAKARLAYIKRRNIAKSLSRVTPEFKKHPIYAYTRAQYLRRQNSISKATDVLNAVTAERPGKARFWFERRTLVRKLLDVNKPTKAYQAAAGYKGGPDGRVVDAQFHAGWIAFRYLGKPDTALTHFNKMASHSTLPNSVSKAHYWLGRVYAATGNADLAAQNYRKAAQHSTTYHGQLASARVQKNSIVLNRLPEWRSAKNQFDRNELVQAIRLFKKNNFNKSAQTLVRRLTYVFDRPADLVLLARLSQEIDAHNLAILIADRADKLGTPLDGYAYPKDGIPKSVKLASVDKALVYAIARQESRFDTKAISSAGARGIMQLMPATARETAPKAGVKYNKSRLTSDPAYNALIGSKYLQLQMKRFNNSPILAAAAYNAGGGNVSKWIKRYGDPRDPNIDPVDWIERIPFAETRFYVQKVMANYQVYKVRLGRDQLSFYADLRHIRL